MPGLGLKRGLADDLVIAPYATALAALVDPAAAAENFAAARRRRASRAASASTRRSTTSPRTQDVDAARDDAVARRRSCAPSSRTTRACRSSRSPTSSCGDVFVDALPRRSARAGHRAAAAGAGAARGDPVGAAPGRERDRRRRRCRSRVAALPLAAHHEPAHALPLERPLHGGAHARRRRLQHVARPRGHAPARGSHRPTPARTSSTCAIRGRATSGRRPISRSASEPDQLRGDVRSRQGHVPRRERRHRDAAPGHGVVRRTTSRCGGCRSPTAATRPREIEVTSYAEIVLARPRGRLRASGVRQAVHRDRVRPAERRPAVQPPAARRRRAARLGVPRARRRRPRSAAPSSGKPIARASSAAAARRPTPSRSTAARCRARTGAVLDPIAALRDRVRLAPGAIVRVTFATGVAADRDGRARAGAQVPRRAAPRRAPSRWPSPTSTSRCSISGSPTTTRILFDRLASRVFGADASCISPADLAREHARPAEPVGVRHLRRSADRARARHRRRRRCRWSARCCIAQEYWRVKGLRADVVILNEHPAEYLDEMQNLLTRCVQEPRWARLEQPAGRHLPAARRRHARRRSASAGRGRARRAARAISAIWRRSSSRPAPWLHPDEDAVTPPRRCARRRRRPSRRAGAAARHGERPRRLHARRPRVRRRARRRPRDAAAVVERARQRRASAPSSARRARRSPGPATAARTG